MRSHRGRFNAFYSSFSVINRGGRPAVYKAQTFNYDSKVHYAQWRTQVPIAKPGRHKKAENKFNGSKQTVSEQLDAINSKMNSLQLSSDTGIINIDSSDLNVGEFETNELSTSDNGILPDEIIEYNDNEVIDEIEDVVEDELEDVVRYPSILELCEHILPKLESFVLKGYVTPRLEAYFSERLFFCEGIGFTEDEVAEVSMFVGRHFTEESTRLNFPSRAGPNLKNLFYVDVLIPEALALVHSLRYNCSINKSRVTVIGVNKFDYIQQT